ncbi:MAG: FMN-binding protein [Coprobacillus sp.]
MKKIGLLILALLLTGCTSTSEETKKTTYKDGTYTTKANGYGGEFSVETTISADKITDVVVKEHNETPSIGGVALEQLIGNMKSKNTYDVDVISGATKTSQGLKDAVKEALDNAKNNK